MNIFILKAINCRQQTSLSIFGIKCTLFQHVKVNENDTPKLGETKGSIYDHKKRVMSAAFSEFGFAGLTLGWPIELSACGQLELINR